MAAQAAAVLCSQQLCDPQMAPGQALQPQLLPGSHGYTTVDITPGVESPITPDAQDLMAVPAAHVGAGCGQALPTSSVPHHASSAHWQGGAGLTNLQWLQQHVQRGPSTSMSGLRCPPPTEVTAAQASSSLPLLSAGIPPCASTAANAAAAVSAAGSAIAVDEARLQHVRSATLQQHRGQPAITMADGSGRRPMQCPPHTTCAKNAPLPGAATQQLVRQQVQLGDIQLQQLLLQQQQQQLLVQLQQQQQQRALSKEHLNEASGPDRCQPPAGSCASSTLLLAPPAARLDSQVQMYTAGLHAGLARGLMQLQGPTQLGVFMPAAGAPGTGYAAAAAAAATPEACLGSSHYPMLLAQGPKRTRRCLDLDLQLPPLPSTQQWLPAVQDTAQHLPGPAVGRRSQATAGRKKRRLVEKEGLTSTPEHGAVQPHTGCAVAEGSGRTPAPAGTAAAPAAGTAAGVPAEQPVGPCHADDMASMLGVSTLEQAAARLAGMTRAELYGFAAQVAGVNAAVARAPSVRDTGLADASAAGSNRLPVAGAMQCRIPVFSQQAAVRTALPAAPDLDEFYSKTMSPAEAAAAAMAAADAIAAAAAAAAAVQVHSSPAVGVNSGLHSGV